MSLRQRTLKQPVKVQGTALHTGAPSILHLLPADPHHGLVFCRTDLPGRPILTPGKDKTGDLVRNTSICNDQATLHTVEHILSALSGCGIHNALIEIDGPEPPVLDGSAKVFVEKILEAGIQEQDADQPVFELKEPVSLTEGNRSLVALPYDGFKITCTSEDDKARHTQHISLDITPETFPEHIAPARTFTLYEDIERLRQMGKIQGGSLDSAIVLKENEIVSNEPLRFENECVRHKILDVIGDLTLLGLPIKAHIIAIRPGHALNAAFTQKLKAAYQIQSQKSAAALDIQKILNTLPHRYPFLLVDRVVSIEGNALVALKNVTLNEPYFQGHFPKKPVMPGVLQVEAMAQAAGILMLNQVSGSGKLTFFMSCDKVKFRRVVEPGDQLYIHVQLLRMRGNRVATASAQCRVHDQVVSSAEMMFALQ